MCIRDSGKVVIKGKDGVEKTLDQKMLSQDDQNFLSMFAAAGGADDGGGATMSKAQKEKLKEMGLRLARDEFSFLSERELKSEISKALKTKKKLIGFELQLQQLRVNHLQAQNQMVMLRQKDVQLNNMLSRPNLSVSENNKLIGQINSNQSQMELLRTGTDKLESNIKEGQSFVNKAREEFVEQLLGVRKLSDTFDQKAIDMKGNDDFNAILGDIEETLGRKMSPIGESKSLARLRTNLGKLESIILSDTIKLNDDGAGTFEATVSINGQETIELIVDSGASLVTIPERLVSQLNIKVGPDARPIQMTIADGSTISGKLVVLESVRMGKFTATNVECCLLYTSPSPRDRTRSRMPSSA